jgi:hypothetical protein
LFMKKIQDPVKYLHSNKKIQRSSGQEVRS